MKGIVLDIAATAIALVILTVLVPQVKYDGDVVHLVIIAALFGLANALVKPIVKLLSFPINFMTMGLFGIVINVGMFMGVAWITDNYIKYQFTVAGWPQTGLTFEVIGTAVIASIVLSIVTAIVGMVVKD